MNDRERLIELIDDALAVYDVIVYARLNADEIADHLIANGVTVQKHGRWIDTEVELEPEQGFVKIGETEQRTVCSECGYYTSGRRRMQTKFCPNCGALLDEKET